MSPGNTLLTLKMRSCPDTAVMGGATPLAYGNMLWNIAMTITTTMRRSVLGI